MQFNWIFVLIVGAIIIAFFLTVVQKCKPITEKQVSSTVISDIDAVITGAKEAKGTSGPIDIPDMEITFSCDYYSIGQSQKKVRSNIIFSPDRIIGETLIPWSLDWGMPYRASNFLFLTSPQVRYILVGDSPFAKEIDEMLTDKISKENYDDDGPLGTLPDKNNYKVKLVFFNTNPTIPNNIKTKNIRDMVAIEIREASSGKGTVQFFKRVGSNFQRVGDSLPYIGNEALIGAIFAENKEMFECNMNKAYERHNYVTQVYQKRTEMLKDWAQTIRPDCEAIYSYALSTSFSSLVSSYSPVDLPTIFNSAKELEEYNSQLEGNSCPLIY